MEERTVERARAKVDRLYYLLNALKFFIKLCEIYQPTIWYDVSTCSSISL